MVKNFNLYYINLYIKCHYFYQQFKDYFKTIKDKAYNFIFFAVFFLLNKINFYSQEHKT